MTPTLDEQRPREAPVIVAIAHAKGGVGKTTSTLILGKYVARNRRVELRDYDESRHLSFLIAEMAARRAPAQPVVCG